MAARPTSSRSNATNNPQVRRNLFHPHLSKRPTSAATSEATTVLESPPHDESSDIIIRDKHGNYQVQVPALPAVDDEQLPEDEGKEKARDEQRLIELYRTRSRQTGEPAEFLSAVRSSLRRKVASLEDDNWMFEAEDGTTS